VTINLPILRPRADVEPAHLLTAKTSGSVPLTAVSSPPRHRDRAPTTELALSGVDGHLTYTNSTVTAWYTLPDQLWAYRPDPEREALLAAITDQYAALAGFRLHLRRTTLPFPANEWADRLDRHADPVNIPAWMASLGTAVDLLTNSGHATGHTMLGVTFARRTLNPAGMLRRLRGGAPLAATERDDLHRRVTQFDTVLAAAGLAAHPATEAQVAWLLHRSIALGLPIPDRPSWVRQPADVLALTEGVLRYRTRYGATTRLVDRFTGAERHIAVLTVGRMEPLDIPEQHEPWLHLADRAGFPVEISSRIDILGPGAAEGSLQHRLRMIRSQERDYAEHSLDAPLELSRLAERALTVGDEVATGLPADSSRAHGWHRLAVYGDTADECMTRVDELTRLYFSHARISLHHPKDQDRLQREFIPGEPVANTGYLRRMPVRLLAAALPQAAATVGDNRGDWIGHAGAGRRPVFLDLHFATEVRERSGLAVFVAEPGGGKSTLIGALAYLAARRGVQTTILDPSGPLARLADMPDLAGHVRVVDLAGSKPGSLNPYALIPTPRRGHYPAGADGDRVHDDASADAYAERRALVYDLSMMLLPPQVASRDDTAIALSAAVRQVPAHADATLDDVVDALDGAGGVWGRHIGGLLTDASQMPLGRLFFGNPVDVVDTTTTLTIITMAGLRLPDHSIDREYWSTEERFALAMLHTAQRLAVRRCYGGDMNARKLVALDEAHFMENWGSGRAFLIRLARDSRKWNLAALVASQNPADILGLDVQNLVSTVFVGRIADDSTVAGEALRLLRIPTGAGYEQVLAGLSQADLTGTSRLGYREFLMRDVDGRTQRIHVDLSYVSGLLDVLDTTPTGGRR
jgi:hypothetical protein